MKIFALVFLLYILSRQTVSQPKQCLSTSACTNGFCITQNNYSRCSCASGYGGEDCTQGPLFPSSIQPIDPHAIIFKPSILKFAYFNQTFDLEIGSLPFEASPFLSGTLFPVALETIVHFQSDLDTPCDYPASSLNWTKNPSTQQNVDGSIYLSNAPWTLLRDCSFRVDLNAPENASSIVYVGSVYVSRRYLLSNDSKFGYFPIFSKLETVKSLRVLFPRFVEAASPTIYSFSSGVFLSLVAETSYDFDTTTWRIDVQTNVQSPYYIKSVEPQLYALTPRFVPPIYLNTIEGCNNALNCLQETSLFFNGCSGLSEIIVLKIAYACQRNLPFFRPNSTNCPFQGTLPINLTIVLDTVDVCPVASVEGSVLVQMQSYEDQDFRYPRSAFIYGTENRVFFLISVLGSTDSTIIHVGPLDSVLVNGTPVFFREEVIPSRVKLGFGFSLDLRSSPFFGNSVSIGLFGIVAVVNVTSIQGVKRSEVDERTFVFSNIRIFSIGVGIDREDHPCWICSMVLPLVCLGVGLVGLLVVYRFYRIRMRRVVIVET